MPPNLEKITEVVFLNYEFSGENQVQLSYSRRIRRPRFRSLNPFFSLFFLWEWSKGSSFKESLEFASSWGNWCLSSRLGFRIAKLFAGYSSVEDALNQSQICFSQRKDCEARTVTKRTDSRNRMRGDIQKNFINDEFKKD